MAPALLSGSQCSSDCTWHFFGVACAAQSELPESVLRDPSRRYEGPVTQPQKFQRVISAALLQFSKSLG